jgi:5-methyltetrahydropteroyltriglutamate--homocysteine methyltransferase
MFDTAIAGSLPKPAWLAETEKLWPQWKGKARAARPSSTPRCCGSRRRKTRAWTSMGDGEQSRQHFVHGFLEQVEGIDFEHKVEMGIRKDRYKAMVPQVVAPLKLKGRVHATEARWLRAHTKKKIKFTLPGPMTIVDTVADRFYGDRVKMAFAFAELLNQEALALQADGVDVIQFDEPAFNVYMEGRRRLGRQGAGACRAGPDLHDRRAHLLRLRHPGQCTDWKKTLGTSGASTRRCSRRWPPAASSRSAWSASTRMCRPT